MHLDLVSSVAGRFHVDSVVPHKGFPRAVVPRLRR